MQLPILYYGQPILRKKCSPVLEINDDIRNFIKDMEDTMKAHNGIGLSAPQVGRSIAIFLTSYPIEEPNGTWHQAPPKVYINPKLSEPSAEMWVYDEGCLSIPKLYYEVARPVSILVTAQDINGKEFTERLTGWQARVCMHENDHLNGVLFIDRLGIKERHAIDAQLKKIKKQYNP